MKVKMMMMITMMTVMMMMMRMSKKKAMNEKAHVSVWVSVCLSGVCASAWCLEFAVWLSV